METGDELEDQRGTELAKLRQRIVKLEELEINYMQAEEAWQQLEDTYSALLENARDGIVIIQDQALKSVNAAFSELVGYTPQELVGLDFVKFVAPENRGIAMKRYADRKAGKEDPNIYEFALIRKDSSTVPVEINATLIEYEGKPAELAFIRDITERKQAAEEVRRTLDSTIQAFSLTTEMRDPYTAGHQRRVTQLACAVAKEMGLSNERIEGLRVAVLVHDIGKIAVPAEILSKPNQLTDIEYSLLKTHSQVAYDILKAVPFPWPIADIVLQHHERINGSGYPHGLKGEEIMLEARILGIADSVEAMVSHRPYQPALGIDKALEELSQNKGVLYDPKVVEACLTLFTEGRFEFES